MAVNAPPKMMKILVMFLTLYTTTAKILPCPNCGAAPVPYPLSTAPTCGQKAYKIRCDAGVLNFDTLDHTYPIISVSPKNQRLLIQQPLVSPNTCVTADLATQGIRLNASSPFTVTHNDTVFLFNCTDTKASVALGCRPVITPVDLCQGGRNGSVEMAVCHRPLHCCSLKTGGSADEYLLPTMMQVCRGYVNFVGADVSLPMSNWSNPAVELRWTLPPEAPCATQACCDSTSTCREAPDGKLRCFCKAKFHWDAVAGRCSLDFKSVRPKRATLKATTMCSVGMILVLFVFASTIFIGHQRIKTTRQLLAREREKIITSNDGGKSAKIFTSKEMKKATKNFSSSGLLGVGGFGEVYKGMLDDGTKVAVKCAKQGNTKSIDQVLNEVRILCQVNHKNLVHILGCCVEKQPLLVYEFIPNGSLFDHLHKQNKRSLTLTQRLGVAHDTAEGLAYLHFSASPPIYHRDVKSSNILLDDNMKAKVADFGLSRLAHTDLTHVTTCAQGTVGYLDPDYYWNYHLTDKSDVYSFGVLLLEILTAQKAIDFSRPTNDVNLVAYVKRIVSEEILVDVIDPLLKKQATSLEIDAMKALGFLAMSCLEERRENRPSMKVVSEEIEYIMGVVSTSKGG